MSILNVSRFAALLLTLGAPILSCTHAAAPAETTPPGAGPATASTDADHARGDLAGAVKKAGEGGLSEALVVRLTADVPVYRMWSGPEKKDSRGNTNRLGQWWSYDAPTGTQASYRTAYEICEDWNELTWVVTCTLKAGAVVTIGPGQSVSAATCGDETGKEQYPANANNWQVFVSKAWTRLGPDKELDCPDEARDYVADLADISRPAVAAN